MSHWPAPLADAYAACEALARSHYENFPVASKLLPAPMRPHVAALYAFARVADDIADEGDAGPDERRSRLLTWQERLHRAVLSPPQDSGDPGDRIVAALGHTIRSLDLPLALFDDLVSAFGQDTMTTRYASWCDLLDYCRRSANPVGRLVLRIAGYHDDDLDRSSDALCTALQLTNFWQDLGRDWRNGRLYVPGDVTRACGAREEVLSGGRLDEPWIRAIEACAAFTQQRFTEGRRVCDGVRGRLRFELRMTCLGGERILEHVRHSRGDLIRRRPALGLADAPALAWRALTWTRATQAR